MKGVKVPLAQRPWYVAGFLALAVLFCIGILLSDFISHEHAWGLKMFWTLLAAADLLLAAHNWRLYQRGRNSPEPPPSELQGDRPA